MEVAVLQGGELATLQVYPLGARLTSPLLPGFEPSIDEVFRP